MTSKIKCCEVDSVFGYDLKKGAVYVGVASIVISTLLLLTSVVALCFMASIEKHFNADPMLAIDMIFALFCISTSLYQVAISIILLWFTLWQKGSAFILTIWFGSHMSILPLYFLMFSARTIICFNARFYVSALLTAVAGIFLKGIFIYFAIVINSYMNLLDPHTIHY